MEAEHQVASCFSCQECKNLTSLLEREHGEDKTSSHGMGVCPTLLDRTTSEENASVLLRKTTR